MHLSPDFSLFPTHVCLIYLHLLDPQLHRSSLPCAAAALFGSLSQLPGLQGEVLLDDRWGRQLGYKLNDAELLGFPWRVLVGRQWESDGLLEVLCRRSGEKHMLTVDGVHALLRQKYN